MRRGCSATSLISSRSFPVARFSPAALRPAHPAFLRGQALRPPRQHRGTATRRQLDEKAGFRQQFSPSSAKSPTPSSPSARHHDRRSRSLRARDGFRGPRGHQLLSSSGKCFIVLGMDEERVQDCVAANCRKMGIVPPRFHNGVAAAQNDDCEFRDALEFARAYMEKMIRCASPYPPPIPMPPPARRGRRRQAFCRTVRALPTARMVPTDWCRRRPHRRPRHRLRRRQSDQIQLRTHGRPFDDQDPRTVAVASARPRPKPRPRTRPDGLGRALRLLRTVARSIDHRQVLPTRAESRSGLGRSRPPRHRDLCRRLSTAPRREPHLVVKDTEEFTEAARQWGPRSSSRATPPRAISRPFSTASATTPCSCAATSAHGGDPRSMESSLVALPRRARLPGMVAADTRRSRRTTQDRTDPQPGIPGPHRRPPRHASTRRLPPPLPALLQARPDVVCFSIQSTARRADENTPLHETTAFLPSGEIFRY